MSKAYIGLGSNQGDRIGNIQQAVKMLDSFDGIDLIKSSSFYETEPFGIKEQNWFVNAIIELEVKYTPIELLRISQSIENKLGRKRTSQKWGPRIIDLDILFYDKEVMDDKLLILPHPATYNRAYCVVPMLEIAKNLEHPSLKKTMNAIYQNIENPDEVYLYGTRPNEL